MSFRGPCVSYGFPKPWAENAVTLVVKVKRCVLFSPRQTSNYVPALAGRRRGIDRVHTEKQPSLLNLVWIPLIGHR
jgi:hypothetical protein